MGALDTSLDMASANGVLTSPRPAGMNEMGGPASGGAAVQAAGWLSLAAAPTFAVMAVLAGLSGGGPEDILCAATRDTSPLSGMVAMYVLMSAFHAGPWLKLISATLPTPRLWGRGQGRGLGLGSEFAASGEPQSAHRLIHREKLMHSSLSRP